MKPEIKKLWIDALRSGEYEQAEGVLKGGQEETGKKGTRYCCLGVLTQLYANENNLNFTGHNGFLKPPVPDQQGKFLELLCPEVVAWAELASSDPAVKVEVLADEEEGGDYIAAQALSELNDTGNSFNQIANLIEAQL